MTYSRIALVSVVAAFCAPGASAETRLAPTLGPSLVRGPNSAGAPAKGRLASTVAQTPAPQSTRVRLVGRSERLAGHAEHLGVAPVVSAGPDPSRDKASDPSAGIGRSDRVRTVDGLPVQAVDRCPDGMVRVAGDYCPGLAHYCTHHLDRKRGRCAAYAPVSRCIGKPAKLSFCIDRFEYPNRRGSKPALAMTWDEAKAQCATAGKRLCTAREWTLACEGPQRLPYPHGYRRDQRICNYDKPYIYPDEPAYLQRATRAAEVARLNQSEPSGSRTGCVSPYGVYDMTGNVDEWVVNQDGSVQGPPYRSGLKGGYWGPVRNRCRPITADHSAAHSGYQIGFRCCAD